MSSVTEHETVAADTTMAAKANTVIADEKPKTSENQPRRLEEETWRVVEAENGCAWRQGQVHDN